MRKMTALKGLVKAVTVNTMFVALVLGMGSPAAAVVGSTASAKTPACVKATKNLAAAKKTLSVAESKPFNARGVLNADNRYQRAKGLKAAACKVRPKPPVVAEVRKEYGTANTYEVPRGK